MCLAGMVRDTSNLGLFMLRRLSPLLLLALVACDTSDGDVTWHQDIAPIVSENCGSCHVPGKIAPFDLVTYDDAAPIAGWIAETVEARTMPPWGAQHTDECVPESDWKDDGRLTDAEIALFRAWADDGAPAGDPKNAAPLPQPRVIELPRVDQTLTPDVGWVTEGDRDEFRCFVLDPELDQVGRLVGLQVLPDNDEVVHHVLVFVGDPEDSEFLDDLVADEGSFECEASNPAPHGVDLISAWAPGAEPMRTPDGTAMTVEAGARLVVQVHYHPLGPAADIDRTAVELMWTDEPGQRQAGFALIGNEGSAPELQPGPNDTGPSPEFVIPAGAKGHVETIIYENLQVGLDLTIWAAGTHMHWVGTDMKVLIRHQDGTEECLVQTPRWDFNWQRWYPFAGTLGQMPVFHDGDTLVLRCTYDNSLDNPFVREALAEQGLEEPVEVRLGDATLDEMCLGVLGITYGD